MNTSELAAKINGREYGEELADEEAAVAKAAGLVVVFGHSDDLLEFRGAIGDEVGMYGGGTVRVDEEAPLPDWEDFCNATDGDEKKFEHYFDRKRRGFRTITAKWGKSPYSWTITSDIPNAVPFDIVRDGEPFCRGLVFSIEDLT